MTPVNDDIAAIEKALAARPARLEAWSDGISKAYDPARLRRVLDTVAALTAERDRLRDDRDCEKKMRKDYVDALEDMRAERDAAVAEVARLRELADEVEGLKDALRGYGWDGK